MRRAERAARQRRMLFRGIIAVLLILLLIFIIRGCGSSDSDKKDVTSTVETEETTPDRSEADQAQLDQDIADGYLILVNKQNYLPSDYEPEDLEGLKRLPLSLEDAAARAQTSDFIRKHLPKEILKAYLDKAVYTK